MDTRETTSEATPDLPCDPPPPAFNCGCVVAIIAATFAAMLLASLGLVLVVRAAS